MASNRIWRNPKVILDSSVLMMVFEFSIDLEGELTRLLGRYEILIPRNVVEEIKTLAGKGRGRKKRLAKAALKFLERYQIIELEDPNLRGDDAVIAAAEKYNAIVATNDKELRRRLREKGIHQIFLRSKKRLMSDEDLILG
ncbi:MAG TPA: nucleotide-binding protein [Thermoplasmatales archaeon]|nr:nucleotide-binding protein [Thermoplasmatales archaeon]